MQLRYNGIIHFYYHPGSTHRWFNIYAQTTMKQILLIILTSLTLAVGGQNESQENAQRLLQIQENPDAFKSSYSANKEQTVTIDPSRYERFKNSPCFDKFGYHPAMDQQLLEQKYCDCENAYYWSLAWKIGLGVLMLAGIGYMVYLSRSKRKPNS